MHSCTIGIRTMPLGMKRIVTWDSQCNDTPTKRADCILQEKSIKIKETKQFFGKGKTRGKS